MKLPNAERAVIDIRKLRDYSLNPNHPEGKHKARVFLEKLEFTTADVERLRGLILEAISKAESNRTTTFTTRTKILCRFSCHTVGKICSNGCGCTHRMDHKE